MTYWDMQVHPGSRRTDFPVEKVRELLETSHLIGMGDSWENDLGQPNVFSREMEKGDVVVIRDGGNIVALVRIAGDCRVIPAAERTSLVWFHIARPVEIVSLDVGGASAAYKEATGLEATEGMSLRRTLNRCKKSDFARFWFVTFCGEEEPLFTWVPFYEELANRLLAYEHDRQTLYALLVKAFKRADTGLDVPYNGAGKKFTDIDPFSVFALVNRRLDDIKKRALQKAVKEVFGLDADAPQDFSGIPHADNRKAFFFPADDDPTPFIDGLWEMFKTALAYADRPTAKNRAAFVSRYDKTEAQEGVSRNLTMGLFWIRPKTYVGLDARNKSFVFDSNEFPSRLVSQFSDLRKDVSSGDRYLAFRDALSAHLVNTPYENFCVLSYKAYLFGITYEHREAVRDRSARKSEAADKACRKPIQRLLREAKDGKDFEKRLATVYKAKKIRAVFPDLDRIKSMGEEKAVVAMQRVNQHVFRDVVLQNYGGKCCISGLPIVDLLEACHILGWKEDEDNRLSPDNGLCMAVIYHRAFDRHLIAIDDDYRLVVSPGLRNKYPEEICQEFFYKYEGKPIRLPERFPPNKFLLAQHRSLLKR